MTRHRDPWLYWMTGRPADRYDWEAHTRRTLRFLYGENHEPERRAMTQADIAAWRALGMGKGAA